MTTVEVLKAARAKVATGWCQGAFAIDERGQEILAPRQSKYGVKWCAAGAILAVGGFIGDSAYQLLGKITNGYAINPWNDAPGRTKEEVLAAFDRAIALAESEAAS